MLPHQPIWNLILRREQAVPWECTWHGVVRTELCAECHREHTEYLATGAWTVIPCRCIDAGHSVALTGACSLHNPVDGVLLDHPVQMTGILSVLEGMTDDQ